MEEKQNRILVVEDMPFIGDMIGEILKNAGYYNYQTFANPLKALEEVKTSGNVGFVIADYRMSGMNGIQLLNEVRAFDKRIQGVLITAVLEEVNKVECYFKVVEKGMNFSDNLIRYINEVLNEKSV
jgi:CheY-like chemotaxis protein